MKTLHFVIIGISIVGGIGSALLLFGEMIKNSQETLSLRFSQCFFNIFTMIPLLVIALGSVILLIVIKERKTRNRKVTSLIILIGSVIIFLGFGMFSFDLID
jgi:hypothetical protein